MRYAGDFSFDVFIYKKFRVFYIMNIDKRLNVKNFEIKDNLIYFDDSIPSEAADYILNRFDNYYDANGLIDVDLGVSSDKNQTNRNVNLIWNRAEKQPTLEKIVEQFETWYKNWKDSVQHAIEVANEKA